MYVAIDGGGAAAAAAALQMHHLRHGLTLLV
jgi:hypothetical protein